MAFTTSMTNLDGGGSTKATTTVSKKQTGCQVTTCRFHVVDGCCLEYCFWSSTEWKLARTSFKYKCKICDKESIGDPRENRQICDKCMKIIKEIGTLKKCKICNRDMDPTKIRLWGTGICDVCSTKLYSVLKKTKVVCPLCNKYHDPDGSIPLTNICKKCTEELESVMKSPYTCPYCGTKHDDRVIPLSNICRQCNDKLMNAMNGS